MWPFLAQVGPSGGFGDVVDHLARTPLSQVIMFVGACSAVRLAMAPFIAKTSVHKRGGLYSAARVANEALDAIIYAGVFVFLIIRPFCIQAFKIPSGSMEDTLQINDFIVANKAIYRYADPQIGDIVVFRPPKMAADPAQGQLDPDGEVNVDFIKRCVGRPGDVVEIRDGVLYRNGQAQSEPFIKQKPINDYKLVKYHNEYWPLSISGEVVNGRESSTTARPYQVSDYRTMDYLRALPAAAIPKGYYLFMGDNRNNSFDGRAWGLVPRDDIIGRSECIWMPISRWQRTR